VEQLPWRTAAGWGRYESKLLEEAVGNGFEAGDLPAGGGLFLSLLGSGIFGGVIDLGESGLGSAYG
jgi:hypothetical protein